MSAAAPSGSRGALALVLAGWVLASLLGAGVGQGFGARLVAPLQAGAARALSQSGGRGVTAQFIDMHGWYNRHPVLTGGEGLPDPVRERVAIAVAAVPGVGGVHWASRTQAQAVVEPDPMLACQSQVEAMLRSRSIRFAESSARIDPVSRGLLDEVATALRPCAGSIIAITGHTDAKGDEDANLVLSQERAVAVRNALATRGIDMAGLRARGVGSARSLAGLDPTDPANRRIEFSLIAPVSLEPTVVDAPGSAPDAGGAASAAMPLWLELGVIAGLTYAVAVSIGWAIWRRRANTVT